jgi:type I restriction enzyme S subunit
MNLNPLIARFESVVESPGNIARLRKLVINLAIGGALISDKDIGPPTEEILLMIRREKTRSAKSQRSGEQSLLNPVIEEELPLGCENPSRFVRLEDIASIEKGRTPIQSALPGKFPLVTTAENKSLCDHFDFDGRAAIIPMVSSTGHGSATLNRLHYHEGKFALGSILCAVFPFSEDTFSARFIFEYLSAFKEELLVSRMTGTANVTLTLGRIGAVPIPILAPNVQQRIDELMALYDRLASAQQERENCREQFTAATHHRLNRAMDTETPCSQPQFLLDQFPQLTARSTQIRQLRETIRNLAVCGRLLPQTDGVAHKSTPAINSSLTTDSSFPRHWLIQPLVQVASLIVDCPHSTPKWTTKGKICVRTNQFRPGYLDLTDVRYVSESTYLERIQRLEPAANDVLYSREGGILGVACRVPANTQLCLGQRMMLIRSGPQADPHFLELVLNSRFITTGEWQVLSAG